jgi:hypothetical protein
LVAHDRTIGDTSYQTGRSSTTDHFSAEILSV